MITGAVSKKLLLFIAGRYIIKQSKKNNSEVI
jgi:hypothetical protein